jgi:5-methylcytosine-specific restriction endonuclease McrA
MKLCGKGCGREVSKEWDRYCLECRKAYNREWRKKNRDKMNVSQRKWRDGQRERGRCLKCTRDVCEFSANRCLLHYLAQRGRRALGGETLVNARVLIAAFEKQDGRCPYTGRVLAYGTAEIDHINPRWTHGSEAFKAANIEWVHPDVNRAKAGMTREDFVALCHDIAQWMNRTEAA